jgi:2-keto-3-deoxy-L-rhamnonate aldolase RhmA
VSQPWDSLRARLAEGRLLGTFLKLPALETVELAAESFDFAVVDLEHSQLDELQARRLVRHAAVLGFPALVRVASTEPERVNRFLESGAAGIQVSTVRRAATITSLRAAMRYAPAGHRSISLGQPAAAYGGVGLTEFLGAQGDGPLLVAQIETATTDDTLKTIAEAGPDVLFVGMLDLAVALQQQPDRISERVAEIAGAAADAHVPLGGPGLDHDDVRYDVIGSDVALLRSSMVRAVEDRRAHVRS